jgi:SAM-dependent methyltransferase
MNATVAKLRGSRSEWFASWFDSTHYHRLYTHRDDQEATRLVDRLIEHDILVPGSTVLDLGCGTGRHSKCLACRGFDVTGIDLSAESLKQARAGECSNPRFLRQDMRLPFRAGPFDHIVNLFTSFGYFDDPSDHMSVVHNIASALRPGGTLVLDYLNVRHAEAHLVAAGVVERQGVVYQLTRWTDADYIFKRIEADFQNPARRLEHVEKVAKFTLEDFRFMFGLYDMTIDAVFGDYALGAFDEDTSPRLMVVARSRPTAAGAIGVRGSYECGSRSRA